MTTIFTDEGPISITYKGDVDNDLRYGSERMPSYMDGMAAPSWYGLHDSTTPWLSSSGCKLTPRSYALIFGSQPLVFTTVMRMLWWAIKVPLKVYQRNGEDRRELRPEDNAIAYSIHHPWERAGRYQLVASLLGPTLVHGNGTTQVIDGSGGKFQFRPRDWRMLYPLQVFEQRISGWESTEDGIEETIPGQEMLHTTWWSPNGAVGISPLNALGVTLEVDAAARSYARSAMKNMARPPSAVTVSNDFLGYEPEERKAAIEWARQEIMRTSGGANFGAPAVLPAGLDWKAVGHTAVEMELIEQRRVDREEAYAVYMMPPPMVGDLTHATYSNVSELRQYAYTDTLGPPLVLIEQAINAQILYSLYGVEDIFVEFDFAGVLRGDKLKEIQSLREAISIGLMAPNEGRKVMNLPPSDAAGANDLYLPTNNLSPIPGGTIQTERTPAPIPAPAE